MIDYLLSLGRLMRLPLRPTPPRPISRRLTPTACADRPRWPTASRGTSRWFPPTARAGRQRSIGDRASRLTLGGRLALIGLLLLTGCGLLSQPVQPLGPAPTPTPVPTPLVPGAPWLKRPPVPINLATDEAPHDVLTEWWYYTGHLDAQDGAQYGFELVVFQLRLGQITPAYFSHFAITDMSRKRFVYDQRTHLGSQPPPADGGFALTVGDWQMTGRNGRDTLKARMPTYAIDLSLTAQKPVALHLGEGYISLGPAGDSYYYSRTRLAVTGTIVDGAITRPVTGQAWFDHQWGDFISVRGTGWDWYSLQLSDQTEVMLFSVRDTLGKTVIVYGSLIEADGRTLDLPSNAISIEPTGQWRSPHSGATYPSGWRLRLPTHKIELLVDPIMADQELTTTESTGVIYWEGAVAITGSRDGRPLTGRGYVELTGYAP